MSDNNILMAQTMIRDLRREGDSLRELIRELQTDRERLEADLHQAAHKLKSAYDGFRLTLEAVVERAASAEAERERLDKLLQQITRLAWEPQNVNAPITRAVFQQALAGGGYTPDGLREGES